MPPPQEVYVTEGKVRGHISSSGQLYAFRNVSVSHVNSESDHRTEISTQKASVGCYATKNKCILSR